MREITSSRRSGFGYGDAHAADTRTPVSGEPVKDILSILMLQQRAFPTSLDPLTTLMTPDGNPASRINSLSLSALSGVSSDV